MDDLLKLLRENARETPANLARMLEISEEEVCRRIAEYERAGTIRGYHVIVNDEHLDVERVDAVIEVKVRPERSGGFDRIAERIANFPEVDSVYLMSGAYDLLISVTGPDLKRAAGFVSQKLATIDGVTGTATHFILKRYKDRGVMLHLGEDHERLQVSP